MMEQRGQVADRLRAFGESIFTPISALARRHDAINLGQGFPNFDGPPEVKQAAIDAISAGHNQYAPPHGIPELRDAIVGWFGATGGPNVDPDTSVTVTSGCTEALPSVCLGLLNPGDEVIVFEPWYDSYPPVLSMAGAVLRPVRLHAPEFRFDPGELAAAFSDRTAAIIINTPHNPTGTVFREVELDGIAALCIRHDAIAITDEVYERLVFDGEHVRLASRPGMAQRTVTLSSLGKTFSLTGWKIGWAVADPVLTEGIRAAHQYLTYATATPLQHGAAAALRLPASYYDGFLLAYRKRRDILVQGLKSLGFGVTVPAGTYFAVADHTPFGRGSSMDFCRYLIQSVGVAAVPMSPFYQDPSDGDSLVRFAFCRDLAELQEALRRMEQGLSCRGEP